MDVWGLDHTPSGFAGRCVRGDTDRIFGGHTLAHAMTAATLALDPSAFPSSLHAVFLAPGTPTNPVRFIPDVIKRGRSLSNVHVGAHQGDRQILDAMVTFHEAEPSVSFQDPPPTVPRVTDLASDPSTRESPARAPFDIRSVPRRPGSSHLLHWIRLVEPITEGLPAAVHASALAYASDFLVGTPGRIQLGPKQSDYSGASLDHAMWFHRPFRADRWLLIDGWSTNYSDSRALCGAQVFTEHGELVATVHQELLFRRVR